MFVLDCKPVNFAQQLFDDLYGVLVAPMPACNHRKMLEKVYHTSSAMYCRKVKHPRSLLCVTVGLR